MTKTSLLIEATPDTRTKKCSECGRVLPISEFNKLRRSKDGHQDRCRDCFSRYNKKRYAENREQVKETVRKYRQENPQNDLETRLKACSKNPCRKNAWMAVDAALKAGVLVKPDRCSGCGAEPTGRGLEAHHHSYEKPLEVVWLCTKCHRALDAQRRMREGLPAYGAARKVSMLSDDGTVIASFPTIVEAAAAVNRSAASITQAIRNESKCADMRWRYSDAKGRGKPCQR